MELKNIPMLNYRNKASLALKHLLLTVLLAGLHITALARV